MASLKIEGGRALSGRVAVEGNKNSALPLIAACMLTDQPCEIDQRAAHPRRRRPARSDRSARRHASRARAPARCGSSARASRATGRIPCWSDGCAARCCCSGRCSRGRGSARLAPPGGDFPARRTITTHLEALMAMGAVPLDEPGHAMHAPNGLKGASFYLDEASVTGTETALLAAAAAERTVGDPPRRDGAARRRALRVPPGDGRRHRRRGRARRCASIRPRS